MRHENDRTSESAAPARESRRPWTARDSIPRWIGIALFIYLSVSALAYAQEFLVPIVLAFLLTLIFAPIRRYFDRRSVPSAVTSLIIVVALLVGFFAALGALALPVTDWIGRAPEIEGRIAETLGSFSHTFHGLFEANEKLNRLLHASSPSVQQVEVQSQGFASTLFWFAPGVVTQFVFTLILLLFLLASGDMFYEKLVHVMPTFHDKKRAMKIARDIERKLSRYLLTITIINAGLGTAVATAMWLVGMPNPIVFGVIAFVFNFVPYLGALAGICITIVVGLVSFPWFGWGLLAGACYLGLATIEGQIVTPYFVGRSLKLNTVVVFIAVSFWAWLWSAIGMIVAVPLLVALRTFCEHIPALAGYGDFLSERHAEKTDDEGEDGENGSQPPTGTNRDLGR